MSSSVNLARVPLSYATASAGMHPSHTLPQKLQAIAAAGFKCVEIAFPDLEALALSVFNGYYRQIDEKGEGDVSKLVDTAVEVNKICGELGLKVLTVMPCVVSSFGCSDSIRVE